MENEWLGTSERKRPALTERPRGFLPGKCLVTGAARGSVDVDLGSRRLRSHQVDINSL